MTFRHFARILRAAPAVLSILLSACGNDSTAPTVVAGSYRATVLQVTPPGGTTLDVLAAGGTLSLQIATDNTTSGTLTVPAAANGGTAFTASMAGTVSVVNGQTVSFQQSADTFVRDLTWTINGNTLTATNQVRAGAIYTVVLSR